VAAMAAMPIATGFTPIDCLCRLLMEGCHVAIPPLCMLDVTSW